MSRIARLLLRNAVRQTDRYYSYIIPEELEGMIVKGSFVKVPFGGGNKLVSGVVTEITDEEPDNAIKLKKIDSLADDEKVMTDEQIGLIEPLARRYNCTRSDIIELFVPSFVEGHKAKMTDYYGISDIELVNMQLTENKLRSVNHIRVLEYLLENGTCDKKTIISDTGVSPQSLKGLVDKGLVNVTRGKASESDAPEIIEVPSDSKYTAEYDLNGSQRKAVDRITSCDS